MLHVFSMRTLQAPTFFRLLQYLYSLWLSQFASSNGLSLFIANQKNKLVFLLRFCLSPLSSFYLFCYHIETLAKAIIISKFNTQHSTLRSALLLPPYAMHLLVSDIHTLPLLDKDECVASHDALLSVLHLAHPYPLA